MTESRPADPRGLSLAVAVVTARRSGLPVNITELTDAGQSPLTLLSGALELLDHLLGAHPDGGALALARVGLAAARTTGGAGHE